jgi:FkbH-like protein
VVETIKDLDRRGIIHTVVSKNDHDAAWAVIERCGLKDYFIHPAINWAPKSVNVKQVAKRINIGTDSIALIDDSAFERAEVSETLPEVRVYSEKDIRRLPELPEFDIPVTAMSLQRRHSYLTEMERDRIREGYGDNYESFLKSCGMELRIFIPTSGPDKKRCWELLQRSNQLNLSSRRYTESEFEELLLKPGVLCLAMDCTDRFGGYGIVGFSSIDESLDVPRLVDFAMSCRVAQKRVEHALFQWLAERVKRMNRRALTATLKKTHKNSPLVEVFKALPFVTIAEDASEIQLELPVGNMVATDIVRVVAQMESAPTTH